ncbi:MAG: hypothetical protein OXT09_09175, partial [Myxococcales bacterium]|nr:hypothetical protein [Myxococcales bacterium]
MFGRGEVYIFDNVPDCEREGFIRFRDSRTGKVGLYAADGTIAVPAEYDDLSRVQNGLFVALQGATKKCLHAEGHRDCEHHNWEGGKTYLVNTNNQKLVEGFDDRDLNFFSLTIEPEPSVHATRRVFRGIDGNYYSFVDYAKDLDAWLSASVLSPLSKQA